MKKFLAVALIAALAACGGDGGDGDGSNVAKFVGDYRICDGDHVETFTTIKEVSPGVLTIKVQDKVHEFKDCSTSGAINGIGWVDYPEPLTFTYTKTINANVYGIPKEFEYTTTDITIGDVTYPGATLVISGSGSVGQPPGCIGWEDGIYCVDPVEAPADIKNTGMVLSNGILYLGLAKNNTYTVQALGVKQ
jgi:hypothetical protein